GEPHYGLLDLLIICSGNRDRSSNRHHLSNPRSELAAEPDVDRIRDVSTAVFRVRPNVDDHAVKLCGLLGGRFLRRGDLRKGRRSGEILCRTFCKVCRCRGLIGRYNANELILRHRLKCVVELSLLAERRERLFRERTPAMASCSVSREN